MSDEQRVTDDTIAKTDDVVLDIRVAYRDERTAHRATEAKLRDALDDIERRRKLANDDGETIRSWVNRATAAESALAATKAKLEALPKVCDGLEQDAFEQWAISEGYDMSQHPLHWLFLHPKTSGARQGWKAAIEYCLAALTTKETTDATSI